MTCFIFILHLFREFLFLFFCGYKGRNVRVFVNNVSAVQTLRTLSRLGDFGTLLCSAMSSDLKLDAVISNAYNEPKLDFLYEKLTFGERVSAAYNILDGLHKQGKRLINSMSTSVGYRAATDRFSGGSKLSFGDAINLLVGEDDKRDHGHGRKYGPIFSGTAYCISSCSMILLNKVVLSSYNFSAGISLMFYQNFISSVVVLLLGVFGIVSVEKLNWKLIRVWLPVNIIFIGMLVSGINSLKYINIAMVTILKNVTNILTAVGELYIFRKRQNQKVWAAMFLMIISALSGGITDLTFNSAGYAWQTLNCVLTASYSLTLRQVMDKATLLTKSGSLNEVSMVLLNNLLSLPLAIFLIFLFGEWEYLMTVDVVKTPAFWVASTASGLLGLAISFTSMWFLHQTGPTTYSLVGSLNKIPISIAGILLFKVPLSVPNLFSILFGLFAGVFFARAKMAR